MTGTPGYFQGKTIVITGAASGIGKATAQIFTREGANVVACDIDGEGNENTVEIVRQTGGRALAVATDVTSREDVNAAVAEAIREFGRIDFMFNCAGAAVRRSAFLDIDDDLWRRTWAINVNGVLYGMQAVLPHMLENGKGVIVNVASMSHKRGGPGTSVHYASAKGAVLTMSLGVAREFARPRHTLPLHLARPHRDTLPGCGGDDARHHGNLPVGRAHGPLRQAGGNRRAGTVHVLGRLRIHDRRCGLCERRRRLAVGRLRARRKPTGRSGFQGRRRTLPLPAWRGVRGRRCDGGSGRSGG